MNTRIKPGYLLEDSNKKKWYFFISEEEQLLYTIYENGIWSEASLLEKQTTKVFSASIDCDGNIYLAAYVTPNSLMCYKWNGREWINSIVSRLQSRFNSITFIDVVSSLNTLHIFYYISNTLRNSHEALVHYLLEKDEWRLGRYWTFLSDDNIIPVNGLIDEKNNLIALYSKKHRNTNGLFIMRFDETSSSWSSPALIYQNEKGYENCSLIMTNNEMLHILWSEEKDSKYYLKCITKKNNDSTKSIWKNESIIYEGNDKPVYPILASDKNLNCIWKLCDKLVVSRSYDNGLNWEQHQVLKYKDYNKIIPYVTRSFSDNNVPISFFMWGSLYPYEPINILELNDGERNILETNPTGQANHNIPQNNSITQKDNDQISKIINNYNDLKKHVIQLGKQVEEMYSALYTLQDHVQDKDKHMYQLEMQLKKISFEFDKIMQSKSYYNTPGDNGVSDTLEIDNSIVEKQVNIKANKGYDDGDMFLVKRNK